MWSSPTDPGEKTGVFCWSDRIVAHLVFRHRFDITAKDAQFAEPSGLALALDGPSYWTVSDNAKRIYRLDAAGRVTHAIKTPNKDLEGIATTPAGQLMAAREDPPQILVFDLA